MTPGQKGGLEEVSAFRGRAKRKDMHVAAWELYASRIVHFKEDFGLTTNTMDSNVPRLDCETSGLTQLPHLVHNLAIVPSLSGGGPGKVKQIFIKGVLLRVHGDDLVG